MTFNRRIPAALLAVFALALGGVACGDDDDSGDDTSTIPEVTIPSDATTTTEPTTTSEETTTTEDDNGGGTKTFDPDQEDSETNDKPPTPGSPEDAFEQDCKANPGKCG
jgi:hypothetical protein